MTISVTSPVTGGLQTGFTAPTYTIVTDRAPNASTGVQYAVTALGGTQPSDVRTHSGSDPFTVTFEKPAAYSTLSGLISGSTGLFGKVGENVYKIRTRKGVNIASDNLPRLASCETHIRLPAGSDSYDPENIRAMISLQIGALNQVSAGLGDTLVTAIL
jgi:hypothetical protein